VATAGPPATPAAAKEIWVRQRDPEVAFTDGTGSLLVSQIGYALPGVRVALITAANPVSGEPYLDYTVEDAAGSIRFHGHGVYAGVWMGASFWRLDLSAIDRPGEYRVRAGPLVSQLFPVAEPRAIYFDPLQASMMRIQLRQRIRHDSRAGFIDAGGDFRETNSHATQVVGMLDALQLLDERLTAAESEEVELYLEHFADFLTGQQTVNGRILGGFAKGEPVTDGHWPNHLRGVYALLRLAEHWRRDRPDRAESLLDRAWLGVEYTRRELDLAKAETTFLTEQLLTEVELHRQTGDARAFAEARVVARELRSRQLGRNERTPSGLWGLFRERRGARSWARLDYHAAGEMTGEYWGLPLTGLVDLARLHPEDPEAAMWRGVVADFVHGFLIPAAARGPFGLVPNGEYHGLRWFSDLFHGMNMTYALEAAALIRYGEFLGEPALFDLAEKQLLWIGGLNTGAGFPGATEPFSCIVQRGYQWLSDRHGVLANVPGSIVNGLSATPQFVKRMPDGPEQPIYLGDESWIAHTGGWLSAAAALVRARLEVANTFKLWRFGATLRMRWRDVGGATGYAVYQDGRAQGRFWYLTAASSSGERGVAIRLPRADRVYYRVSGNDGVHEGPR